MTYGKHFSAAKTPPTQPLPGREKEMIQTAGGGYVFQVGDIERLRRFLILGNEGGTYYASESKLTRKNAQCVLRALAHDGKVVVDMAVDISDKGLAPKNDPAIFVLALASVDSNAEVRKYALAALPKICRIPTHLFTFAQYRQDIGGGWGRGMRAAVAKWYTDQTPAQLAVNALKYPSRNGWSHRDLLRLAHPAAKDEATKAVFDAISAPDGGERLGPQKVKGEKGAVRGEGKGWEALRSIPAVDGWLYLRRVDEVAKEMGVNPVVAAAGKIRSARLQREMVPTELLTKPEVWDALLPNLGYTALLRNLGNLSKCGLLAPLSEAAKYVEAKLGSEDAIRGARVHPFSVLLAARMYAGGKGFKGKGEWTAVPQVVDALDHAFDLSFGTIVPTGKRYILGIDVSSSMSYSVSENSPISAAEAAAAFAMITARTEQQYAIMGFAHTFKDLKITAKDSLATVLKKTKDQNFGSTDCALPLRWAREAKIEADVVLVYTDNEMNTGPTHVTTELAKYRQAIGPIKLGVVGFTATESTVADPKDLGQMNFVGLDASLPQAINAFVTG
jgi:60 kDa SS-A/Ro ribonucleoprotein